MAITIVSTTRRGRVTTVTVSSDLVPPANGATYFHWYVDGVYVGYTRCTTYSFAPQTGGQIRVAVNDTTDPAYDPIANAPTCYPARRMVSWLRSIEAGVSRYRVEQQKNGGDWTTLGTVRHDGKQWEYSLLTPRLVDLATYVWRVIPIDKAGNDGTAVTLDSEDVVRTPDSPAYEIAFDDGTTKVTFSGAA